MKYRAALIGLGNIGFKFGKDLNSQSSLSHYSAYDSNPSVEIVAGFSPDKKEVTDFESKTGIKGCYDLDELFDEKPDIVSVCSPTVNHLENTELCINNNIPMIWLEKPVASNLDELNIMRQHCLANNNPPIILVNFFRRYHRGYSKLKDLIRTRQFGKILSVNINYSRGLLNNGLHMLDIIHYLFDISSYEVLWKENGSVNDNPSFILKTESDFIIYVDGTDSNYHDIDVIVTMETAKLSVVHGGMTTRVEEQVEHELFPNFHRLHDSGNDFLGKGGFLKAFDIALSDLIDSYEKKNIPKSNLETAYFSHKLMESIISND